MSIVTRSQYAKFRGKSPAWVSEQMKKGMPHQTEGVKGKAVKINTVKAIAWEFEQEINRRGLANTQPDAEIIDINTARKQLIIEQERKYKLENDLLDGTLLPAADVERGFNEAVVMLASLLDGAAGKMAQGDAILRQRLLDEHRRIRDNFANKLESIGGNSPSQSASTSAT